MQNLDWSVLTDILISVIPALLCITFHELSHGLCAYALGDPTAKNRGRLSLNPLKHLDITGLITLVVFKLGWAKPVPVNMWNFKHPKRGMALTALMGPVSNLMLAVVMLVLYGELYLPLIETAVGGWILEIVYTTAYLSISLAIFNLIPIPPLDGSKVLFSVVSDRTYTKLMQYERYGMILLVIVMFVGVLDGPIRMALQFVMDLLFPIAEASFGMVLNLFY